MKSLIAFALLSFASLLRAEPVAACEEDARHKQAAAHHLDLSLPPLHPDGVVIAANPKVPTAAPMAPKEVADAKVPPADPDTLDDDIDDTKLEGDVMPHVEEDSAGALDDMGDVGGDFEE